MSGTEQTQTTETTQAATQPSSETTETAVTRPDFLPETYWDAEKNAPKAEDLTKDLTDLATLRTEKEARVKETPEKPEGYEFKLPEDFKVPDGLEYKAPDANDPEIATFRSVAKEIGLTQTQFVKLMGFEAQRRLGAYQGSESFRNEQMKALGANAVTRVEAAQRWLNANVSETQAKALSYSLNMKDGVEAVEALIAKTTGVTPKGAPGTGDLRAKPNTDGMSPYERLKAANAASMATH